MDLVHDRGSMERSKVGVHGPLVHVLSFGSKAITGSSFKFKLSHRSFAYWQTDLCEFGENFGGGSAIQRVHEWRPAKNFPPNSHKWHEPQLAGESLIWSLRHIKSINAMGSDVTVLTFQCLCSSFNIQFDRDPFDVFICCSTVFLKNALMLKVAQKIVTLFFWNCFHLDFKDHVSRRKYYAARNLTCDRCVI